MPDIALGESIPPNTPHAVSVSLPTWKSNVGYEEGEAWVVKRMVTGYPRFFVHKSIDALAADIAQKFGSDGQKAMLFPTKTAAARCARFIQDHSDSPDTAHVATAHLVLDSSKPEAKSLRSLAPSISAVIFPAALFPVAKQYWQHTGDGVSSRRAEFCHTLFQDGLLVPDNEKSSPNGTPSVKVCRGPRRYQRNSSLDNQTFANMVSPNGNGSANGNGPAAAKHDRQDDEESSRFLEERFGRNLDISLLPRAQSAIKRRIAGALSADIDISTASFPSMESNTRGAANLKETDIYVHPGGMNAIYNAHRYLLAVRGNLKSINFGFPYVDTLKILQKFGPGCEFFGRASAAELDELEARLEKGERFLALFCEFPGNPLLTCPDLVRIKSLADKYDFAVVVDETIGTFANVNVLPYADIVVSSLTKIFSGDCNVMGGGLVLNPSGRYYDAIKAAADALFEDTYWAEDFMVLERNSRDFAGRIRRTDANAEVICDALLASPLVRTVYYPKFNPSRPAYEACRLPDGGYGSLLSVVFHRPEHVRAFFDALDTAKGPSLGTNFTLTSPYVLLAHYQELDWAKGLGVDPDLVRISVGLEEPEDLRRAITEALEAAGKAGDADA